MKQHRTLKIIIVLTALVLSLLPQLAKAQGNLVVNGGFDTNAGGWTLTGSGRYDAKNGNPPGEVDFGGSEGAASQTINSLTPEFIYNVSGDYQAIVAGGASTNNYSFGVSLEDVFLFGTATPTNSNWYSFNFQYKATSSSTVLSLSQISGVYYNIDNIAMYAVPEPSSLCLIGLGGIMSAMLFRKRRKGRSQKIAIVLTILTLSYPPRMATAQGNLIVNGDSNAGTPGWTLTNGAGYDSKDGDPVPSLQFANTGPPANPTASQTINGLSIGTTYSVLGNYRNESTQGSSFGVAINDVFLFEDTSSGNQSWQTFSFFYTAASSSAVLSLSAQINGIGTYDADNISMYAVPEPGVLVFWGLGGLAFLWHRQKAKAV
jgi:hypothetical protein